MYFMEKKILNEGEVKPGNILKVGSFLNQQLDVVFLAEVGKAFHDYFGGRGINKILTVEASGIAIACMTAQYFRVPVLFAKKSKSRNLDDDLYTSVVHSFTYDTDNVLTVSKRYLTAEDRILILDDFLAAGAAVNGMLELCRQAGAAVAGIGAAIEKGFQGGGDALRAKGYDVCSLAIIDAMSDEGISFRRQII